jgi:hypothetical protein
MTHKLTLEISDEVYQPLWQKAQATGQTVEAVVQSCLAESLRSGEPGSRLRRWAGSWASNVPDAAHRHDEYLGQALYEELQERRHD